MSAILYFQDVDTLRKKSYIQSGTIMVFEGSGLDLRPDVMEHSDAGVDIQVDDMGHRLLQHASLVILQYCDHDTSGDRVVLKGQGADCPEDYQRWVEGLILVRYSGRDHTFTRLGLFTVWGGGRVENIVDEHVKEMTRTITLI